MAKPLAIFSCNKSEENSVLKTITTNINGVLKTITVPNDEGISLTFDGSKNLKTEEEDRSSQIDNVEVEVIAPKTSVSTGSSTFAPNLDSANKDLPSSSISKNYSSNDSNFSKKSSWKVLDKGQCASTSTPRGFVPAQQQNAPSGKALSKTSSLTAQKPATIKFTTVYPKVAQNQVAHLKPVNGASKQVSAVTKCNADVQHDGNIQSFSLVPTTISQATPLLASVPTTKSQNIQTLQNVVCPNTAQVTTSKPELQGLATVILSDATQRIIAPSISANQQAPNIQSVDMPKTGGSLQPQVLQNITFQQIQGSHTTGIQNIILPTVPGSKQTIGLQPTASQGTLQLPVNNLVLGTTVLQEGVKVVGSKQVQRVTLQASNQSLQSGNVSFFTAQETAPQATQNISSVIIPVNQGTQLAAQTVQSEPQVTQPVIPLISGSQKTQTVTQLIRSGSSVVQSVQPLVISGNQNIPSANRVIISGSQIAPISPLFISEAHNTQPAAPLLSSVSMTTQPATSMVNSKSLTTQTAVGNKKPVAIKSSGNTSVIQMCETGKNSQLTFPEPKSSSNSDVALVRLVPIPSDIATKLTDPSGPVKGLYQQHPTIPGTYIPHHPVIIKSTSKNTPSKAAAIFKTSDCSSTVRSPLHTGKLGQLGSGSCVVVPSVIPALSSQPVKSLNIQSASDSAVLNSSTGKTPVSVLSSKSIAAIRNSYVKIAPKLKPKPASAKAALSPLIAARKRESPLKYPCSQSKRSKQDTKIDSSDSTVTTSSDETQLSEARVDTPILPEGYIQLRSRKIQVLHQEDELSDHGSEFFSDESYESSDLSSDEDSSSSWNETNSPGKELPTPMLISGSQVTEITAQSTPEAAQSTILEPQATLANASSTISELQATQSVSPSTISEPKVTEAVALPKLQSKKTEDGAPSLISGSLKTQSPASWPSSECSEKLSVGSESPRSLGYNSEVVSSDEGSEIPFDGDSTEDVKIPPFALTGLNDKTTNGQINLDNADLKGCFCDKLCPADKILLKASGLKRCVTVQLKSLDEMSERSLSVSDSCGASMIQELQHFREVFKYQELLNVSLSNLIECKHVLVDALLMLNDELKRRISN